MHNAAYVHLLLMNGFMHRCYDEINACFFNTITFIRLQSVIFGEKLSIMLSNNYTILKICISTKNLFKMQLY